MDPTETVSTAIASKERHRVSVPPVYLARAPILSWGSLRTANVHFSLICRNFEQLDAPAFRPLH
jgi:hypothetical protein